MFADHQMQCSTCVLKVRKWKSLKEIRIFVVLRNMGQARSQGGQGPPELVKFDSVPLLKKRTLYIYISYCIATLHC